MAIPFFTDQNVPDSVGNAILTAGHELVRLRDVMDVESPDPVIAVACSQSGQVLVTHDGDFKGIAKRLNITQRAYRTSLHRVLMKCPEPVGAARIMVAMPLLEYEWRQVSEGKPLFVEIHELSIKIWR